MRIRGIGMLGLAAPLIVGGAIYFSIFWSKPGPKQSPAPEVKEPGYKLSDLHGTNFN